MNEIREALLEAADEQIEEPTEEVVEEIEATGDDTDVNEAEAETTLTEAAEPTSDDPVTETESTTVSDDKPPVGWTPTSREHWAGMDAGVKQQIMKREREVEAVLQESSDSRRLSQEFNRTVDPFRSLMAAEGAKDPIHAVGNLLQTAATLKMGSAQQKAERISQLIQHYGVDIETLDGILSGQPSEPSKNDAMQQAINERMAPMEQMFQGFQNQQNQQLQQQNQRMNEDINTFGAKAEFFTDVRMDMADIMDMAAKRGVEITLEQAYEKATQLHPEISKVLATRKQQTDLGIKKNVAGGILNGKLGGEPTALEGSLRETLESAWSGG